MVKMVPYCQNIISKGYGHLFLLVLLVILMTLWLQEVLSSEHILGNRTLEVKVATPKVITKFLFET